MKKELTMRSKVCLMLRLKALVNICPFVLLLKNFDHISTVFRQQTADLVISGDKKSAWNVTFGEQRIFCQNVLWNFE